jgi:hypothetical protein
MRRESDGTPKMTTIPRANFAKRGREAACDRTHSQRGMGGRHGTTA